MATPAHKIEVVARHHAAIADEDHALEPEALLQITKHFGNRVSVAPITLEHMVSDWPTIHQDQTDQHLSVAWLVVTAVAKGPLLGRAGPFKVT
jgi:hypothetical protein